MASRRLSIGVLIWCGLCAYPAQADFYDASADFSATSDPNGPWSYGWSQTLGSAFILDATHENVSSLDFWEGTSPGAGSHFPAVRHNGTGGTVNFGGTAIMAPGQLALHPGPGGEYAVVRFLAPTAGVYSLSSAFTGIDTVGTTTDVHILLDGSSIYDGIVSGYGNEQSFSKSLSLGAGDIVDFEVGYGANKSYFNDSTGLAATLTTSAVPEPGGLVLMGVAALGIAGRCAFRRSDRS